MMLTAECAAAEGPLSVLRRDMGALGGAALSAQMCAGIEDLRQLKAEDFSSLVEVLRDAAACRERVEVDLSSAGKDGVCIPTTDLCHTLLGFAAAEKVRELGVVDLAEDSAPEVELLLRDSDLLWTKVCCGARGWCLHVFMRGENRGVFCGRRCENTVCSTHPRSGLDGFLRAMISDFPDDPSRSSSVLVDPITGVAGDGTLLGCLACCREVSESFLANWPARAPAELPFRVGPFLLVVDDAEIVDSLYGEDGPPVVCSACLAACPMHAIFGALVRELARGEAGPEMVSVDKLFVIPTEVEAVPKTRRGDAFSGWENLGLPIDCGFGSALGLHARGRGLSPAGKEAFARSPGRQLRRREHHTEALGAAMLGPFPTPIVPVDLSDEHEDQFEERRAEAPPSVGREIQQPTSVAVLSSPSMSRVMGGAGGAAVGIGSLNPPRHQPLIFKPPSTTAAPAVVPRATTGGVEDLLTTLTAEVASLRLDVSTLRAAGGSGAREKDSILLKPPEWFESDHSVDRFGFAASFGGHGDHVERHKFVDMLGTLSVLLTGDAAKAYGKSVFAILGVARVDKAFSASKFPFSHHAKIEKVHEEVEVAKGVVVSTGQKALSLPLQATWLKYLEGLVAREYETLCRSRSPTVAHGAFRMAQSKMIIVSVQFFVALSYRLTVHHKPPLSWDAAYTTISQVFYEYFWDDAWQPHGLVKELMDVAEEVEDVRLRAVSGGSPLLETVTKVFVGANDGLLRSALEQCGGGGGGGGGGAGGGGAAAGGGVAMDGVGSMCGQAGCPGYRSGKYLCQHVFTKLCSFRLSAKAGGGQCGMAHASYGPRAWTCAQAKALSMVVAGGKGARGVAFKGSFDDYVAGGGATADKVKDEASKLA